MTNQGTMRFDKTRLAILRSLGLPEIKENNQYLVLHVKGDGVRAPPTWNAKVYRKASGVLTLHTTDMTTFLSITSIHIQTATSYQTKKRLSYKNNARIVMIDDSGWGFPLGGVLIGIWDSRTQQFMTGEVPVMYFQSPSFERKDYLRIASQVSLNLIKKLDIHIEGTLIKLCQGYVNNDTQSVLESYGYRVERCKITEPLQSKLEMIHLEYINKTFGSFMYYDPKGTNPYNIGRQYNKVIEWIKINRAWRDAKTGWKSIKKIMPNDTV